MSVPHPYLARLDPAADLLSGARVAWGASLLSVACHRYYHRPPPALVTSVRALVLRRDRLLVMQRPEETHLRPGGRVEPGERWLATLRRELLEETGWRLHRIQPLALLHYHHLTPAPAGYPYPYPDFLQLVCLARARSYHPAARRHHPADGRVRWLPLPAVATLPLDATDRALLRLLHVRRLSVGPSRRITTRRPVAVRRRTAPRRARLP